MAALEGCNASPDSLSRPHRAAASDAVVRIAPGYAPAPDPPDNPKSMPEDLNRDDQQEQQHAAQRVRKRKASRVKLLLPHQLAAQRTADFDLDVIRKRALLGLQIQAGLDACPADRGVYETDKWDPCKPFVADKMLSLPCMLGRPVVYSSSTLVNIKQKGIACAEGHIADKLTIQCHGCSFKGSRTRYEQHLGSNAKKSSQHIWLKEEQISIKELAVLCSAVDLSLTHCIYCKQDQCSDIHTGDEQPSTPSTPDGEAAATPARTATAEFPPALATAERGVSEAAGTSGAADAAAATAADGSAGSKGLLAAECQLRPRNTLAACSTCPAVFHTNCYHSNTREEVGEDDDWQCISCRQGAECASNGCNWCSQHAPHERSFTMTGLLDDLKHELEPQQAEGQIRRAPSRAKKPAAAAAAAGRPKPQEIARAGFGTALGEGLAATGAGPTSPATPAAAAAALAAAGDAVAPAVAEKHQCLDEPAAPAQAPGSKPAEPQQVLQSPHGINPAVDIALQAAFGTVAGGAPAAPAPAPATARRSKRRASAAPPAAAAAVGAAAGGCGDSPSNKAQPLKTPARKKARIANPLSTPPAATPEVTTAGTTAGNQSGQQVAAQLQSREGHAAAAAAAAGKGGRRRRQRQQQGQQQGQQHEGALANNVQQQQQQQQDQPPATLGTPDTPGQQQQQHPGAVNQQQQGPGTSQLDLGLLGVAEWLPAWSNQYQAEADLYSLCMAAEAPDSLVQQLQAVMDRLQGLQAADLAVCQFKAHYTRLQLWGKRRNAAEFEAALLRLASMG